MSMEISIDILPLLSVNPIRICKVFSQIFTNKEHILLKPFTSGKSMVF